MHCNPWNATSSSTPPTRLRHSDSLASGFVVTDSVHLRGSTWRWASDSALELYIRLSGDLSPSPFLGTSTVAIKLDGHCRRYRQHVRSAALGSNKRQMNYFTGQLLQLMRRSIIELSREDLDVLAIDWLSCPRLFPR